MENILQSYIQQKDQEETLAFSSGHFDTGVDIEDLHRRSDAFARLLKDAGCREGDYICCVTGKVSSVVISMLGIMKAGCICVPVNSGARPEQIRSLMTGLGSRWILADEQTMSLPDPLFFESMGISLGWMGKSKMVPGDIIPEFISENIEQYVANNRVSSEEPDSSVFRFTLPGQDKQDGIFQVSSQRLFRYVARLGAMFNGRFSTTGRGACFLPDHLRRFFAELMQSEEKDTCLYVLASGLTVRPVRLASVLHTCRIRWLIVDEDDIIGLTGRAPKMNALYKTVDELVIMGKLPPHQKLADLKSFFPGCNIKNRVNSSAQTVIARITMSSKNLQLSPVQGDSKTAREKKVWLIPGLSDEPMMQQLGSRDFIRGMKEVYLNYWRRVEEKNLWSVRTPARGTLRE